MLSTLGGYRISDLRVPPAPGSLMRAVQIPKAGVWRLSRRDCELYSILIGNNAWGRFSVLTGTGRPLFRQPSTFSGSFYLQAGSEEGLIVEALFYKSIPIIEINWREPDLDLV